MSKTIKLTLAIIASLAFIIGLAFSTFVSTTQLQTSGASSPQDDNGAEGHSLTLSWAETENVSADGHTYVAKPSRAMSTARINLSLTLGTQKSEYAPGEVKIIIPKDIFIGYSDENVSQSEYINPINNQKVTYMTKFSCGVPEQSKYTSESGYYYIEDNDIVIVAQKTLLAGDTFGVTCTYSTETKGIKNHSTNEFYAEYQCCDATGQSTPLEITVDKKLDVPSFMYNQYKQYPAWKNYWGEAPENVGNKFFVSQTIFTPSNGDLYGVAEDYFLSLDYHSDKMKLEKVLFHNTAVSHDENKFSDYFYEMSPDDTNTPIASFSYNRVFNSGYDNKFQQGIYPIPNGVICIPGDTSKQYLYMTFIYSADIPLDSDDLSYTASSVCSLFTREDLTTPIFKAERECAVKYEDLRFVYSGDSVELQHVKESSFEQPTAFTQYLLQGAPAIIGKTPNSYTNAPCANTMEISNFSFLWNREIKSYSYGVDGIYLNESRLAPDDYELVPYRCLQFITDTPPEDKNSSAQLSSPIYGSFEIKTTSSNEWERRNSTSGYLQDERNIGYAIKIVYDFNEPKRLYAIKDQLMYGIIFFPTENVQNILKNSDSRAHSVRVNGFVEVEYANGERLTRTEDNAVGTNDLVESLNEQDLADFGYLPYRVTSKYELSEKEPSVSYGFSSSSDFKYTIKDDKINLSGPVILKGGGGPSSGLLRLSSRCKAEYAKQIQQAYYSNLINNSTIYLLLPKGVHFDKIDSFSKPSSNTPVPEKEISYRIERQSNFCATGRELVRISYNINHEGVNTASQHDYGIYSSSASLYAGGDAVKINFSSSADIAVISQYGKTFTFDSAWLAPEEAKFFMGPHEHNGKWNKWNAETQRAFITLPSEKAIYSQQTVNTNADVAYIAGPKHALSTSSAPAYTDNAFAYLGEDYSYRLAYRTANDGSKTTATDMILFSTLGQDGNADTDDSGVIPHLKSVSTYQLEEMGIAPAIYYTAQDLDLSQAENQNVDDVTKWILASSPDDPTLKDAKRLAVDCRHRIDGTPFTLEAGKYIEAFVNMSAPISSDAIDNIYQSDMYVQAAIAGATGEGTGVTTTKAASTALSLKEAPISLTKSSFPASGTQDAPAFVQSGKYLEYIFTASNQSNTSYKDIVVEDVLPSEFVLADDNWAVLVAKDGTQTPLVEDAAIYDEEARKVTITVPELEANGNAIVKLVGTLNKVDNDVVSNSASIVSIASNIGISADMDTQSNTTYHKFISFDGVKKMKDGSTPRDGEFSFTLSSITAQGDTIEEETVRNDAGGKFTFDDFELYKTSSLQDETSDDGRMTHKFQIAEDNEGATGVTYDESVYIAEVVSSDENGDGAVEIESVSFYKVIDGDEVAVDEIEFVNDKTPPVLLPTVGAWGFKGLLVLGGIIAISGLGCFLIVRRAKGNKE